MPIDTLSGLKPRRFLLQPQEHRIPKDAMADPRSTSVLSLRMSCGEDVSGGVHVPIVRRAAGPARPLPLAQLQPFPDNPAGPTGLGRGKEPIDLHEVASVPRALVRQHPDKLAPSGIADRAGQLVIADHPEHVQVLDHDRLVFANEPSAEFLEMVPPPVNYPGMQPR